MFSYLFHNSLKKGKAVAVVLILELGTLARVGERIPGGHQTVRWGWHWNSDMPALCVCSFHTIRNTATRFHIV